MRIQGRLREHCLRSRIVRNDLRCRRMGGSRRGRRWVWWREEVEEDTGVVRGANYFFPLISSSGLYACLLDPSSRFLCLYCTAIMLLFPHSTITLMSSTLYHFFALCYLLVCLSLLKMLATAGARCTQDSEHTPRASPQYSIPRPHHVVSQGNIFRR